PAPIASPTVNAGLDPDAGSAAMREPDSAAPGGPFPVAEPEDFPSAGAPADVNADDAPRDTAASPEALPEPAATLEIIVGESGGAPVAWKPSVQGSPHLFVTGIPGQGKSWTVLRLMIELARQGVPSLSFDFHGQFGAAGSPYVRLAHPTVLNAAAGLPFSPFECSAEGGVASSDATALAVAEIFGYIAKLGDIQRDTLYRCIRDAYRSLGFGSTDGEAPREYPTLDDILRRLDRAQQDGQARNVLARCRALLEMNLFRPPAGERHDLMDTVRQGLVVDLHQIGAESLQLAAGAFLLRKIYTDMFGWGEADRIRLAIVLDEAHRLAKDVTLPKIMKEGRKFGVLVIVASQGLADFHPDVLKNVGTQIAFKATHLEANKIGAFFRGRSAAQYGGMLQGLGMGTAIVQNSEMVRAVVVRMRPPE
ncbi:MAG: DUF87 domain-containing protein, partial [Chloroflexi bacterium]|nr:DUF87 domain-containing protein [Chloroflexota bacterium]